MNNTVNAEENSQYNVCGPDVSCGPCQWLNIKAPENMNQLQPMLKKVPRFKPPYNVASYHNPDVALPAWMTTYCPTVQGNNIEGFGFGYVDNDTLILIVIVLAILAYVYYKQ